MDNRIIGGTNTRPDWDEVWMDMARVVGQRARCDRDKVGAVIVPLGNDDGLVASYNGPPYDLDLAAGSCLNWCERAKPGNQNLEADYSDCPSAHAEQNAITRSDFTKIAGGTIYVTSSVCFTCAKSVANSGIRRVVMMVDRGKAHRRPTRSIDFLTASGLNVEVWTCGFETEKKKFIYIRNRPAVNPTFLGMYGSQLGW